VEITHAVDGFRDRAGHVSPGVISGVRAVVRAAQAVERKLA
jgi:hypothetical protein